MTSALLPLFHAPDVSWRTSPSLAMTLTPPPAMAPESSIVATVVPPISFSESANAMPTDTATPLLTATATLAETSAAVIDELSTASTDSDPSASTALPFTIEASTSFVVTFLAHAPAPEIATATELVLTATLTLAAAAMASISLSASAETVTSPPVVATDESSMDARLAPSMVFLAADTARPSEAETVEVPADTATEAAITFELIAAVSLTLTPMSPTASSVLPTIRASVDPPRRLVAEAAAKAPARLTVPVPAATLIATATVLAWIWLPALAPIETAPPLSTSESSMPASVSVVMVFDVIDTAPANDRVTVPEPAATDAASVASVASIVLSLSASRVIGPPAMTKSESAGNTAASASAISASTVPPIVLVAIAAPTAPEKLKVPLLALTEMAAARPRASMFLSEIARTSSAPPASSDESST